MQIEVLLRSKCSLVNLVGYMSERFLEKSLKKGMSALP